MLTGLYPHKHGAIHNTGTHLPFTPEMIGQGLHVYPNALRQAGYQLGYAGKWHSGIISSAADAGFVGYGPTGYGNCWQDEEFDEYLRSRAIARAERVIEFYAEGQPQYAYGDASGYIDGPVEATPSSFLAAKTIDLIDEFSERDQPFFLMTSFWGPHAPYMPAGEFSDMYDPEDILPWESFDDDLRGKPYVHGVYRKYVFPGAAQATWDVWAKVVARYYGFVSMIDAQIGIILGHLRNKGLYDDTFIVFASDHGDTLGIHGGAFDKGAMAYEEIYNVPLIVKGSGNPNGGKTCEEFVSLLDLPSTFVHIAGREMPGAHGTSLLPILEGASMSKREHVMAQFHGHRFPVAQRVLWWDRYKFVLNFADRDELYDLDTDGCEMDNLISRLEFRDVHQECRQRLLEAMTDVDDTLGPQARHLLERSL
tara:strand:- start:4536 stop:5804 length:1269 start_codon:yes stop_codon:yes gene_type:complete